MSFNNNLILRTAKGESVDRTPVWLMRQAGRILPEYRLLREKVKDFKTLVITPELACEITMQPVYSLGVDAAIIFSDILVVPEAMGLTYKVIEKKGPYFEKTINSTADIEKVKIIDPDHDLSYVALAIKLTKKALNNTIPLIGFAGAPWTIFAYMVEGNGSKSFSKAKKFLYQHPTESHELLHKITESTINYLKLQINAGADIVQIFDSWAEILSPEQFKVFSYPYINRILNSVNHVPKILFAKGAHYYLKDIQNINCEVIGLDWTISVKEAREIFGTTKCLQGNMDPCLLYADRKIITEQTREMLNKFGPSNHIANLGHGVYPDTPLENVKCFVDTVKQFRFE